MERFTSRERDALCRWARRAGNALAWALAILLLCWLVADQRVLVAISYLFW